MGLQVRGLLGIYEILSPLGAGGMGEVYRARDTRLNRDVALKVLPEAMAHDTQRMGRFEREARTLASLNHPNIAAIYGLEESNGSSALVMELVEGETLAERIAKSSKRTSSSGCRSGLQMEECLGIAKQIAEAMEYAHEHGIVHRDLKPANVKITPAGTVKVLDFGLAKVLCNEDSAAVDPMNSPTLSTMATQAGAILGTAAYMAPEQAKGKSIDRRVDIWAFGCVVYEILTGQKAFHGETVSDVIAAVIKSEPDWNALPPDTPPTVQRLVRRCLQKDPRQRLQAIGDARIAIEEVASGTDPGAQATVDDRGKSEEKRGSRLSRVLPWTVAALLMMALIGVLAAWRLLAPAPQPPFRFTVSPPENAEFDLYGASSISPDGRTLAFVAQFGPGKPPVMWLRSLDSLTAQPVAGTEGALLPFWSPDGREIGFFATDFKLKKVAVSGGTPQVICDIDIPLGATWNSNGVILLGKRDGVYSVPDIGGRPTLVLAPDTEHGVGYSFPQFLPDGRHFLVTVNTPGHEPNIIGAGSLDSKTVDHLPQTIGSSSAALYAPPGNLFYLDQGTLVTRPFDAGKLRFTGPAVPVAQNIGSPLRLFSASQTGVLTYVSESTSTIQNTTGQMTWLNRSGQKVGMVGTPGIYSTPALSPDGTRLAAAVGEHDKQGIWIYDLKRGTASRLTFNPANDTNPSWSPDGSQILFSSTRVNGSFHIYEKAADGLGSEQPVSQSGDQQEAINDVSADGRYAIYDTAGDAEHKSQLWALPLSGDHKPFAFVQGDFGATSAQFSPNVRYVAYTSSETGRQEVYVQTFPKQAGKWQISTSGGTEPMWRRDGKELFYLARGDNSSDIRVMSVAVNSGSAAFQAGIPKELFRTQLIPLWLWRNVYVPSPDGQRFLMVLPASQPKPSLITVVVNWPATLKK